jgi:hypothetical protein
MRLTLIALLLTGVVGCDSDRRTRPPQPPVEEPKPETGNGGEEEPTLSFEETRNAAEQGDVAAQRKLGVLYFAGNGVSKNVLEAVKWFRKAAEQGDAEAQNTLGAMYVLGEGVPEDATEAVKWYRKAAEQGDISAQTNLGVMYGEGKGVPQDYGEAYAWYSLYGQEKTALRRVKVELTPEQLTAAEKRVEELTEQINANKAK